MATAADIAEYDTDELERQLGETRRELFNLRFQLATGQLDNFSRINHVRKDVARMMTELRIREIAEAEGMAHGGPAGPPGRRPPTHGGRGARPEQDHRRRSDGPRPGPKRKPSPTTTTTTTTDDEATRWPSTREELAEEVADDDGDGPRRRCAGRRRRGPGSIQRRRADG